MKNKISTLSMLALTLVLGFTSCKKEEGCTDPNATNYNEDAKKDDGSCVYATVDDNTVEKIGILTSNETWTNDKIWVMKGRVVVSSGVTLTIQEGTIIKGAQGQELNASALVVARGGKINAVGTADKPIIFTSILDNIKIGEKTGSNLLRTDNEKWGGVAVLGYAKISAQDGDTETKLEGLNPDAPYSRYGGSDDSDSSGVMKYVSIRHGGISIGEGNELNGLTLGGVGNRTVIENVEVYATLDDGIECFGGAVNISNALVYYQGDDGIDLDQNYSGTIENFMVIHGDGIGTDKGLEIDGTEGSTYTTGKFILRNGLVKSEGQEGTAGDFKDKAQGTVENVTFDYSSQGGSVNKLRAKFVDNCANHQADSYTRLMDNDLVFTNIKSIGTVALEVYTASTSCANELSQAQTQAETKYDTNGTGATVSPSIFSWTCAGLRGQL